jgi:hypothetical protein
MFRWLFIVLALGLVVLISLIGIRQLPALQRDIQRYIGMRTM